MCINMYVCTYTRTSFHTHTPLISHSSRVPESHGTANIAIPCNPLQPTSVHFNTLQHTATHLDSGETGCLNHNVAKTHRTHHLCRSISAKEPYLEWKRPIGRLISQDQSPIIGGEFAECGEDPWDTPSLQVSFRIRALLSVKKTRRTHYLAR